MALQFTPRRLPERREPAPSKVGTRLSESHGSGAGQLYRAPGKDPSGNTATAQDYSVEGRVEAGGERWPPTLGSTSTPRGTSAPCATEPSAPEPARPSGPLGIRTGGRGADASAPPSREPYFSITGEMMTTSRATRSSPSVT
jgi:hypothetical protein